MSTCARCGAELQSGARFCVMCGARVEARSVPRYATSTLAGSGLAVAISTAAMCAAIAAGLVVLIRSMF